MSIQVITEDGAIIEVGAEIYFQIVDAEKSVTSVQNLDQSTRILVQTSLCNILAKKPLADIEAERRLIADTVLVSILLLHFHPPYEHRPSTNLPQALL